MKQQQQQTMGIPVKICYPALTVDLIINALKETILSFPYIKRFIYSF